MQIIKVSEKRETASQWFFSRDGLEGDTRSWSYLGIAWQGERCNPSWHDEESPLNVGRGGDEVVLVLGSSGG